MAIISPAQIQNLPDIVSHPYIISSAQNQVSTHHIDHEVITFPAIFFEKIETLKNLKQTYKTEPYEGYSKKEPKLTKRGRRRKDAMSEPGACPYSRTSKALTKEQE